MLEHRIAFDSLGEDRDQLEPPNQRLGLHVTTLRDKGLLLLQCPSVRALQEAVCRVLHLTLPPAQQAAVRGAYALLWLAPAEWLLELPRSSTGSVELALAQQLRSSLAAITDSSDALAVLEVRGSTAADTLMTGCSLDLRPPDFPAGRVVRTAIIDVPAILWNPGYPDRFRCLIDPGFAEPFIAWLDGTTA